MILKFKVVEQNGEWIILKITEKYVNPIMRFKSQENAYAAKLILMNGMREVDLDMGL